MKCCDCGHKGEPIGFDDCPMCGGYMEDPDKEIDFFDEDSNDDDGYDDGYGDDHEDDKDDWQIF